MKDRVVVGALALLAILVVLAGLLFLRPGVETLPTTTLPRPTGRTVSMLPSDSLVDGFGFDGPVDEAALTPPENAALPTHVFEGRLELLGEQDGGRIQVLRGELGPEYAYLPEFDFEFVQSDSYLIPIRRGLIITDHPQWNLHLEPGRVWQEVGDGEFSRASLPFALTVKGGNATFNGTLTFLFDEQRVSKVWYQVTQETTTYTRANLWGLLEAAYHPSPIVGVEQIRADFAAALATRLPVKPIQALAEDYPGVDVSAFGRGVTPEHMTWYGVVVNGINYLGGCQTRFGIYPYCESMRATSYSTAKSAFPSVALMRLAQQYGPEVVGLLIKDYVPEYAASSGDWEQVTFNDAIDMASGNYVSAGFMVDDNSAQMGAFFSAQPYVERIKAAFDCPHAAEPGTRWVYRTSDTFILTRALHNYLQTQEGPQADIFQFVVDEVYRPLGLGPGAYSTMRTADNIWQGQPEGGYGLWWTPDDIAKIVTLLNNDNGAIGGVQVLQPDLLAATLQRNPDDRGVRIDGQRMYNNAFWANRYTQADGFDCEFWVPQMLGVSGNVVALMPNGVTYYYFSDNQEFTWDAALREADKIVPFCRSARSTLTPAFTEATQLVETTTTSTSPTATATAGPTPQPTGGGVVHGWAVLAEKDYDTDVGKTDLMGRLPEIPNSNTMDSARPSSTLWAIHRYYEYTSNEPMRRLATDMRQQEITKGRGKRRPLRLKDIPGVAAEQIEKLAAIGIVDVEGVLETGRTREEREELSRRSGVPPDRILELVKLADLTRIVDIKGVRVRLLYEAGVDTVEKVSMYDPEGLREKLIEVNEDRQILKRHPTLVETKYWITQAKALQQVVEY